MRRFVLILLALIILALMLPLTAAAEPAESAAPVNISGTDITFDDSMFAGLTSKYNHQLALAAAAMCGASYRRLEGVGEELDKLGFGDFIFGHYDNLFETGNDISAYTLASKEITVNGKTTQLTVVLIRGTFEDEWYSNFNIGTGDTHAGFAAAADEIYAAVQGYLPVNSPSDSKLLVTGHSRGAAVANLLAAKLNDGGKKDNLYCYTFATPGTSKAAKGGDDYNNIFNFVNDGDLIPYLPLKNEGWKFGRYGRAAHFGAGTETCKEVETLIEALYKIAPTVEAFYEKPENGDDSPSEFFEHVCKRLAGGTLSAADIMYFLGAKNSATYKEIADIIMSDLNQSSTIFTEHDTAAYIDYIKSTPAGDVKFIDEVHVEKIKEQANVLRIVFYIIILAAVAAGLIFVVIKFIKKDKKPLT